MVNPSYYLDTFPITTRFHLGKSHRLGSGRFAAEKFILLFAAAVGAAEAAEEQHPDPGGNKNREDRPESKERMS